MALAPNFYEYKYFEAGEECYVDSYVYEQLKRYNCLDEKPKVIPPPVVTEEKEEEAPTERREPKRRGRPRKSKTGPKPSEPVKR